jgi:hypothetical protein
MLSVWGVARRRSCCRNADVLPCCTHLYAVTFSCWLYIVFCSTGATPTFELLGTRMPVVAPDHMTFFAENLSCFLIPPLLRQNRQCRAVWWRHGVVHWLFYYVVSAYFLAEISPCRGAHILVVKFRFFTDFSSAVVATCLLETLVSNENGYSENRFSENRCSENHIFLSGVNYVLPCFFYMKRSDLDRICCKGLQQGVLCDWVNTRTVILRCRWHVM